MSFELKITGNDTAELAQQILTLAFTIAPNLRQPAAAAKAEAPVVEAGTLEERLHTYTIATLRGDVDRSYSLFLGLAGEESARPALRRRSMCRFATPSSARRSTTCSAR